MPFRRLAVERGDHVHLVGAEKITGKTDPEYQQVFRVQTLPAAAEHGPGVENQRQIHPDYRSGQHHESPPHCRKASYSTIPAEVERLRLRTFSEGIGMVKDVS